MIIFYYYLLFENMTNIYGVTFIVSSTSYVQYIQYIYYTAVLLDPTLYLGEDTLLLNYICS